MISLRSLRLFAAALLGLSSATLPFATDGAIGAVPSSRITAAEPKQGDVYLMPSGGDDTGAIEDAVAQAALSGSCLRLGEGTFVAGHMTWGSNTCMAGSGRDRTIIKRKAQDSIGSYITLTGHSYKLADLTIDGDKDNQTHPVNLVQARDGFYELDIRRVRITGAKQLSGGYGAGLMLGQTTGGVDADHNTVSVLDNVELDHNDAIGAQLVGDDGFRVTHSTFTANGAGFAVSTNSFPTRITARHVTVEHSRFFGNFRHGIAVGSYIVSVSAPLGNHRVPGPNPVGQFITIADNEISNNAGSGVAFQGQDGEIVRNTIHDNGSRSDSGILANANRVLIAENLIYANNFGVDAGGCRECRIIDNTIHSNSVDGVNAGASVDTLILHNHFKNNPSAVDVHSIEFGGGSYFAWPTSGLRVVENDISIESPRQLGIVTYNNAPIAAYGNKCHLANSRISPDNCYRFENDNTADTNENGIYDNADKENTMLPAAPTLVLPDGGRNFVITGTATISDIVTHTGKLDAGKIYAVTAIGGDGGNGLETVSFSNGDCLVQPTGAVRLQNDGRLAGIEITGKGSGCRSAPTCTIVGGSLSPRECAAISAINNVNGRHVTLFFDAPVTVTSAYHIHLLGEAYASNAPGGTLTLLGGKDGHWREVARSGSEQPF